MTDVEALKVAINVLSVMSPMVRLMIKAAGTNGERADDRDDNLTLALFRLEKIAYNLRMEGRHVSEDQRAEPPKPD